MAQHNSKCEFTLRRVLMDSVLSTLFWGATVAVLVVFGVQATSFMLMLLSLEYGLLPFNYTLSNYLGAVWAVFERGTAIEQPQVAGDGADKNAGCPAPNAFRVGALMLGCVLGGLIVPGIVSDIQRACGPNAPRGNTSMEVTWADCVSVSNGCKPGPLGLRLRLRGGGDASSEEYQTDDDDFDLGVDGSYQEADASPPSVQTTSMESDSSSEVEYESSAQLGGGSAMEDGSSDAESLVGENSGLEGSDGMGESCEPSPWARLRVLNPYEKYMNIFPLCIRFHIVQRYMCARRRSHEATTSVPLWVLCFMYVCK